MNETKLRRQMVDASLELIALGLNRGASGNLSVRFGDGFRILGFRGDLGKGFGIILGLLNTRFNGLADVFCLNHGNR